MTIILTDETALAFWRRSRLTGSSLLRTTACRTSRLASGAPPPSEVIAACDHMIDDAARIHVLVGRKQDIRRCDEVKYSSFSGRFPSKSLHRLNDGMYVTGPEFAFTRMSAQTDLLSLVRIGFELTGSFAMNKNDMRGFSNCKPLTATKEMAHFLDHAKGLRGSVRAKQALRHILDGAASPMEAEMAMLLTLPKRLGGYGLPKPILNYRLDLACPRGTRLRRSAITVDAAWPKEKLALEYDSDQFHTGAEKIAVDSERRNDILFLGYDVKTITRKEITSVTSMDKIAESIARRLGVKVRKAGNDFPTRQSDLRRRLLRMRSGDAFGQ